MGKCRSSRSSIQEFSSAIPFSDDYALTKVSGHGIKIDTAAPTFGWRDILGAIVVKAGATDPAFTAFRGTLNQYAFSNAITNEIFNNFHIPHDYVMGTDIFFHVHWGQNVVDTGGAAGAPGNVKWYFDFSYAKGHNQAAFPAAVTNSVVQTASGTQYQHMLIEFQMSAASPSASQIDSDIIEPDGIIMVRIYRNPADVADTLDQVPFVFFVDIHYQSTNIATKQKAPDFYV